jgi:DNA-binding transcriptional regulator YhcF (GntR family)
MTGNFLQEERIPSVREMAIQLEVNPNTVMRTYEFLQSNEIIYNKRGVGYFVSPNGKERAFVHRKNDFIENELPSFMQNAHLLGITSKELLEYYLKYQTNQ